MLSYWDLLAISIFVCLIVIIITYFSMHYFQVWRFPSIILFIHIHWSSVPHHSFSIPHHSCSISVAHLTSKHHRLSKRWNKISTFIKVIDLCVYGKVKVYHVLKQVEMMESHNLL